MNLLIIVCFVAGAWTIGRWIGEAVVWIIHQLGKRL